LHSRSVLWTFTLAFPRFDGPPPPPPPTPPPERCCAGRFTGVLVGGLTTVWTLRQISWLFTTTPQDYRCGTFLTVRDNRNTGGGRHTFGCAFPVTGWTTGISGRSDGSYVLLPTTRPTWLLALHSGGVGEPFGGSWTSFGSRASGRTDGGRLVYPFSGFCWVRHRYSFPTTHLHPTTGSRTRCHPHTHLVWTTDIPTRGVTDSIVAFTDCGLFRALANCCNQTVLPHNPLSMACTDIIQTIPLALTT